MGALLGMGASYRLNSRRLGLVDEISPVISAKRNSSLPARNNSLHV